MTRLLDSLRAFFRSVGVSRGACKFVGVLDTLVLKLREIKFTQSHAISFVSFSVDDGKFSFVVYLVRCLSFAGAEDDL